jgi:hypothetical protein
MSFIREPNAEPIPGYRLIEPLGSGGFGEVWKCEAPGGLFKAIKFVFGNLNSLDVDGARAEQELKALNRVREVRHPFVLSMDRIEVVEGELVIVMEVADKSLHDYFEECLQAGLVGIPRDTLLRYIRDAAEALDHMNEKHNLQHLDIKPRNLFLVSDRVKVADFGLVKTLERSGGSGMLGGVTPLYAPPETYAGKISPHSDQYSLAIVYQELLTGQRPYNGKNARALAQQHMSEEPDLRVLPEGERPVVARALAKDPNRRFPNCLSFVRSLYTAQSAVRPERIAEVSGEVKRPKTLADTMEDMLLGQMPDDDKLVAVDLGELDPAAVDEAISKLGVTKAQPQTGALRPTLVIGLGGFGRRALQELRCRCLDRFGDLGKVPLLRFLYIDTDADAVKVAARGAPEVALKTGEIYHLPLQPIGHYRRRQLDQLNEWLPREKLYTLPRSLKTQSSRALGRLAFSDNYIRLMARLRREIQQVTHPDAIYQSVTETGLALRDNTPRVYVIGGAGGGASGYIPDLGYALRRLLQQLREPEAPVTAMVFCGAPDDPATPRAEQANIYATLTELNHFYDAAIPFSAQYGSDGPRLVDDGAPYNDTYLITLTNRTPEGRRDAMAHLGSYLFHELTTPLGLRLDRSRMRKDAEGLSFRSLGTYSVWFPRGLMLRLAARSACKRMLEDWQVPGDPTSEIELDAALARVLTDPELDSERLGSRVAEVAAGHMEGPPGEALTGLLASLEEQSLQYVAQDDPAAWARQALTRVRDWLGSGIQPQGASTIQVRKSRLTRALEAAAVHVAEEWEKRFNEAWLGLMEYPGRRLAVAEAAVARFVRYCNEAAASHAARLQQQSTKTKLAQQNLQNALENCVTGGGFGWFGGRSRRQIRVFIDHLAAFARQCLAEDVAAAVQQFFTYLRGRLADQVRDLTFCRQRLRHMLEALESDCGTEEPADNHFTGDLSPCPSPVASTESYWESIRESATTRVVLPSGESDLEQAAEHFLATLNPDLWLQLDQALQDQVLAVRGGLFKACMNTNDLLRHLVGPLLVQAVSYLSNHLPVTDVAQVECSTEELEDGTLPTRLLSYYENAEPLLSRASRDLVGQGSGVRGAHEHQAPIHITRPISKAAFDLKDDQPGYLLIPASEAGKKFGQEALKVLSNVQLVTVPGQADLMFCREQGGLRVEDMERILRACRPAYEEAVNVPNSSPHARFDLQDWTPLDP